MKIEENVLKILDDSTIEENVLKLNSGQLDRKMYLAVNKILEAMGGKWNRKMKGHVFEGDVKEKLDHVLLTGEIDPPKKFGYFPTPKTIIEKMIEKAEILSGHSILEPSAGQGHILDEFYKPDIEPCVAVELLDDNRKILKKKGYYVADEKDFLKYNTSKFDRIIMNPPFEKQADIDHVTHAFELLEDYGRLVSIMSAGILFRENNKTKEFRKLVEDNNGSIEKLPENSFKESGTLVNTVMVVLNKTE